MAGTPDSGKSMLPFYKISFFLAPFAQEASKDLSMRNPRASEQEGAGFPRGTGRETVQPLLCYLSSLGYPPATVWLASVYYLLHTMTL